MKTDDWSAFRHVNVVHPRYVAARMVVCDNCIVSVTVGGAQNEPALEALHSKEAWFHSQYLQVLADVFRKNVKEWSKQFLLMQEDLSVVFPGKMFAAIPTFYLKPKTLRFFLECCLVFLMVLQTGLVNQCGK